MYYILDFYTQKTNWIVLFTAAFINFRYMV